MHEQTHYPAWKQACLMDDLRWLVSAPPLIQGAQVTQLTLDFLGWDAAGFEAWLQQLTNPPRLANLLLSRRLGQYHEALWQLLLEAAPAVELVADHLAIRELGRTLGELDFLYWHHPTQRLFHLEVAIKFYLGDPDAACEAEMWRGPASQDRLVIKAEQMQQRQLALSCDPRAQSALQAVAGARLERLSHQLVMPGVLFYPWSGQLASPQLAHPQHWRGHWMTRSDFTVWLAGAPPNFAACLLHKPHWLALPQQLVSASRLEQQLAQVSWPVQLAWRSEAGPVKRLFLVEDGWPGQRA
ncbi:DUF1853 family protein [Marinospirillum sp. MEB164]|uniref:DUF1853 family protein n=1 Tax=Marinospirillum alkalitolerans TaxID=3123374 RepID=A0ABW8PUQ5_9GAMM